MTKVTIETNFDKEHLRVVATQLKKFSVFSMSKALQVAAKRGRESWSRRMATKLVVEKNILDDRSEAYEKKRDVKNGKARSKVWVGGKRAITAKDSPSVLTSPGVQQAGGLIGSPFKATMPTGHEGTFFRAQSWIKSSRNSYRRLSLHYFKREDGQNTYLPIREPKIVLTSKDSQRTLIDAIRSVLEGDTYQSELEQELERNVKKIPKGKAKATRIN